MMHFKLVDAFTDKPLGGNPCAVLLGAENLTDEEMLAIAREMNQSETAFLMRSQSHHLKARYFTPEREIPLAGHPTIASIHAAIEHGLIKPQESISLELIEGPIRIDIELKNGVHLIHMFQRKPKFLERHDPLKIADLFNLKTSDFLDGAPIQTVCTGTPMMMVPLKSRSALADIKMNVDEYKKYREKSDFFSPHFFILSGATTDGDTFARHLGMPPDTFEDAFTGSATGCMGAFLWKYGLLTKNKFVAEQGHEMGRPGKAVVEAIGDFSDLESVVVAGTAVTVVDGTIRISKRGNSNGMGSDF